MAIILSFLLASALLILATRVVILSLANKGLALVLALALPELFVVLAAILENRSTLAIGNLLGANIADLSLVVGLTVLVGGSLAVVGDFLRWEMAVAFLTAAAPILLLADGVLSRFDGLILVVIYLIYLREVVFYKKEAVLSMLFFGKAGVVERERYSKWSGLIGLVGLIIGADLLVRSLSSLAIGMALPTGLIGVTLAAMATTLPEVFLGWATVGGKKMSLILRNLLAASVTNSTLLIGLVAIFRPTIVGQRSHFLLASTAFIFIFGLFWLFAVTKKKISRAEGLVLLGVYLMFIGLELLLV